MTSLHPSRLCPLMVVLLPLLCGCGNDTTESEVQFPDWLSEQEGDSAELASQRHPLSATNGEAGETAGPNRQLSPGDRFPLRKTVEQELTQPSLNGQPELSRSRLELTLAITVADIRDEHTLMQVKYDHVTYTHEVAGERVEYDSSNPPQEIPAPVLAYHGMVGDGFSFWLGADNQIAQVIGFREFVERCLAHIPAQQRQQALQNIGASAGEAGIADFVDNTIGLLPRDADKVAGDHWEKTRHVVGPVPMQISTVYTLDALNDQTADVTIGGRITPSTPLGAAGQETLPVHVTVNGGQTTGHCTIDRESGLPRHSQVERIVDMTVQMSGGVVFNQQKRTLTTVESLPQQSLAGAESRPMFR